MPSSRISPRLSTTSSAPYLSRSGARVGAGVYSVIGGAAGMAQQNLWLSFLIGAIVALQTGFSYAMCALDQNRRCWQRKVTPGLPLKADF
jgi:amino acid transporter